MPRLLHLESVELREVSSAPRGPKTKEYQPGSGVVAESGKSRDEAAGCTTSYVRVGVLEPGGAGSALVAHMKAQPHVEHLSQRVSGELMVSGERNQSLNVNLLLDSGSERTSISEECLSKIQDMCPWKRSVVPFKRTGCVRTTSGEE